MLKKLRNKIEKERDSKNFFCKSLVFGKDFVWNLINFINSKFIRPNLKYFNRNKALKLYLQTHNIRKLHIGCGGIILDGWLNTDLNPGTYNIFFLDTRKKFPFEDCTFDYVFSEHLLEHLQYKDALSMIRECFRILKPGGKIRIATPDLCFLIELYNPKKTELQKRYISWAPAVQKKYIPQAVNMFTSEFVDHRVAFIINNLFRGFGHKFIYDFKLLRDILEHAGFTNAVRCNVGESADSILKNIELHLRGVGDEFNMLETLVIEAIKPLKV